MTLDYLMPNKIFPITAEVKYGAEVGHRFWTSSDEMFDELRDAVVTTVKDTERDVIPRGAGIEFSPNIFTGEGINIEFEFADTHEVCVSIVAKFHMPVDAVIPIQ